MDEKLLKMMFERSQQENPDKMGFTEEESSKFKKAFEDPEFRKLFADYVDELQDPQNREETEAYISQLEGEQKVPAGRELIRYFDYAHTAPSSWTTCDNFSIILLYYYCYYLFLQA